MNLIDSTNNFFMRALEPLPKEYCMYFYYLTFLFLVFLVLITLKFAYDLILSKKKSSVLVGRFVASFLAVGVNYFTNRLFYSVCVGATQM